MQDSIMREKQKKNGDIGHRQREVMKIVMGLCDRE